MTGSAVQERCTGGVGGKIGGADGPGGRERFGAPAVCTSAVVSQTERNIFVFIITTAGPSQTT